MKAAELAKLGAGFVAGMVASEVVKALVPNPGTSSVDEVALVAVAGISGWKALKPGKLNKVYAGAMLGAAEPVLRDVAGRIRGMIPIGNGGGAGA